MGEPGVSTSPTQLSTQRRVCVVGLAQGFRCLPVLPGTEHCAKHHPDRAAQRSEQAAEAAKASHATWRPDPELEAWADAINWDDEAAIHTFLRETAVLVAKKALSPQQGQVMARLAEERLKGFQKTPAAPQNLLVEVQRFDRPNGAEASETP
jgi:hypothetical protein